MSTCVRALRGFALTLAALLTLAAAGRCGDAAAVEPLMAALEARVDAIAAEPQPTAFEKQEGKALAQAFALLLGWGGGTEPQDLARLTKAAAAVAKSKTFDIPVLGEVGAIRDVLDNEAESARQDAAKVVILLVKPAIQAKLDKRLARADEVREEGHVAWPEDYGQGARKLARAVTLFRDCLAQAEKGQLKEAKKQPNDATVVESFLVTPVPAIGHPVKVTTVVNVTQPTPKLTVVIRVVLKSDVDAATDPTQDPDAVMAQCVLGEYTLVDLPAGERSDTLTFVVPKEYEDPNTEEMVPLFEDHYYLMVELDVHDELIELAGATSEDNNVFIETQTPYLLSDNFINSPNVVLESVVLDPKIIYADTTGTPAALFGVTMTVTTSGNDEPISGATVVTGIETAVTYGGGPPQPLYLNGQIWDPVEEAYVSSLQLPDLVAGQPLIIHLDIRYEPPLGGTIPQEIDPGEFLAELLFGISSGVLEYEPDGPDNSATVPDCTYVVVPLPECSVSADFGKAMGNDNFAAAVSFASALDITDDPSMFPAGGMTAGAVGTLTGGVDVTLMGFELDFVTFEAVLERDPVQDYSYFGADLYFLDFVIYSTGAVDTPLLESIPILPDGVSFCDGGFCYTKDFDKSKDVKKVGYFFPGGVPVTVTGKVEGKIGFNVSVSASDGLTLAGGPFVELLGGCDLALGVCPAACVGAGGELTLVKDSFITTAGAGMTVLEEGENQSIDTALCFSVWNKIEMLNGKLFVFAQFPWCDTCWAFLVPYPCNCGFKKVTLDIIKWDAFVFCQPLIDEEFPLCCTPVTGDPICNGSSSAVCNPSGCPEEVEGD
jgi:hypothetical protein